VQKIRVWDLPLRAFHWMFAFVVLGAIVTNLIDAMVLHSYFGYSAFVMVCFRFIWGVVGPTHARFWNFIPSISELKRFMREKRTDRLGHNPFGALSVMAILLVTLIQAGSGLFTDDEISFQGPLAKHVSDQTVKLTNQMHEVNHWLVYGVVALHLTAIFYYQWIKKENLIRPMVTGDKMIETTELRGPECVPSKDDFKIRGFAFALLVLLALLFRYFVMT